MFVTTLFLIALAAIANIHVATTNAFVPPTTTRRYTGHSRRPWSKVLVSTTETPSTSNDTETASVGSSTTSTGFWDRLESVLFAPLEAQIENSNGSGDGDGEDDPRLVLAEWKNIWEERVQIRNEDNRNQLVNGTATARAATESLTNFLEVWAKITLQNDKGLTTPVSPTKFQTNTRDVPEVAPGVEKINGEITRHDQTSTSTTSMKLIFRPPKRYLSYKEQKSMEKNGVIPDRKGAKVDAWSPGGVEIRVTMRTVTRPDKMSPKNSSTRIVLGVTALRCNIDGDTVIKKTSERAIVRRLENAIRIWEKSNSNKNR